MTVKELIEELNKVPQDKRVEVGNLSITCGIAARVLEYDDYVEIESNEN